jgi:uncharacterized membrane protein YraQ (UPF0718 family)/YHS domain-containing protein
MAKSEIDPVCGMKGHLKAHGHYFCSQGCIRKYEKDHGIKTSNHSHKTCKGCAGPRRVWYKERLFLILWGLLGLLGIHLGLSLSGVNILLPFWLAFWDYLALIWWAVLIGFLAGGFIEYYIPRKYIQKYLALHRKRAILYAVLFGFLASACSHGVLAIAIELYRKGASTPSVIAFLLASPWANLPITILLFGFFGINAFLIILSALIIAISTGFIFQVLDRRCLIECSVDGHHGRKRESIDRSFSIRKDVSSRLRSYKFTQSNILRDTKGVVEGSWSLTRMVMWWLLIGMALAAFARAYIPEHLFMAYLGPSLLGLGVTLFFATVIEVCSEGSSPLAFEIFRQTGAFGNSFTFLMAGVATDYTEIGLVASNIGRRAAIMIPLITVPQILVLGYLFNMLI